MVISAGFMRPLAFALVILGMPVPAALAQEPARIAIDRSLAPYASEKDTVTLPDGRRLHLVCMGQGGPTVILLAGNMGWSAAWNRVQAPVAEDTRVCAWDRAGFGLSDPPPHPQTVDQSTADLATALEIAGIAGPYILVGHSLGGYESLLLADRDPAAMVGMVLVDSSYNDQFDRLEHRVPAIIALGKQEGPVHRLLQTCSALLRSGSLKKGDSDPNGCFRAPPPPPHFPPELVAAMPSPDKVSEEWIAQSMDAAAFALSWQVLPLNAPIVSSTTRNYTDMPLVVLSAGTSPPPPGWGNEQVAELPVFDAVRYAGHREYAAMSTRGVQRTVPGSTHDIHQTHPEAVIAAIREVLAQVR